MEGVDEPPLGAQEPVHSVGCGRGGGGDGGGGGGGGIGGGGGSGGGGGGGGSGGGGGDGGGSGGGGGALATLCFSAAGNNHRNINNIINTLLHLQDLKELLPFYVCRVLLQNGLCYLVVMVV